MSDAFSTSTAAAPAAPQRLIRPVLVSALLFMLVSGIIYPLVTTGVAQALFPSQAGGSLIARDGTPVGSRLIGQEFSGPGYFHGRPSATRAPDPTDPDKTVPRPYNAALSGSSNLGPTNRELLALVGARTAAYRAENRLAPDAGVPVDAVTASASGLDPDISVANARLQALRVADARRLKPPQVLALVARHTAGRQFGLLGEPRVNVLELNLALDAAAPLPRARP